MFAKKSMHLPATQPDTNKKILSNTFIFDQVNVRTKNFNIKTKARQA